MNDQKVSRLPKLSRDEETLFFWDRSRLGISWPQDAGGWVFLARAILQTGEGLHADWTGREWNALTLQGLQRTIPSASMFEATPDERHAVRMHLIAKGWQEETGLSGDEWRLARGEMAEKYRPINEASVRWFSVMAFLKERFLDGRIRTAIRPKLGGDFEEIGIGGRLTRGVWNSERTTFKFVACELSPDEPFSAEAHPKGGQYIFVLALDLQKAFSRSEQSLDATPSTSEAVATRPRTAANTAENVHAFQTRIALLAVKALYPNGVPHGGGLRKDATRELDKEFAKLALAVGKGGAKPPGERKWRRILNDKQIVQH